MQRLCFSRANGALSYIFFFCGFTLPTAHSRVSREICIKQTYKHFNVAGFELAPLWKPSKCSDQLSHTFLSSLRRNSYTLVTSYLCCCKKQKQRVNFQKIFHMRLIIQVINLFLFLIFLYIF